PATVTAPGPMGEEAIDEGRRAGALAQLELPVADEEIGPDELIIVAGARIGVHADGEHAAEEGERRGDGPDRDRHVVDAESGKGRRHGDGTARPVRRGSSAALP